MSIRIFPLPAIVVLAAAVCAHAADAPPAPPTAPPPAPIEGLSERDIAVITAGSPTTPPAKPKQPRKLLIHELTTTRIHGRQTAWAAKAFAVMGERTGAYAATINHDPALFDAAHLAEYDAIVLDGNMGYFLGAPPENKARYQALLDFVRSGKGLIALHAVSTTPGDGVAGVDMAIDPGFAAVLGGSLQGHPWNTAEDKAVLQVDDPASPICADFIETDFPLRLRNEELYMFYQGVRSGAHVLLSVDIAKTKDKGGRPDRDYPLAWIKRCGDGRVFHCALGHSLDTYSEAEWMRFHLAGIQYALGDLACDDTPGPAKPVEEGDESAFTPIFDGKSLDGWKGEPEAASWSVEDGAIVGRVDKDHPIAENGFLVWQGGAVRDFELRAEFLLESGNSGIYFRARERQPKESGEALVGMQADMDVNDATWPGTIMEWTRRQVLAKRGEHVHIHEDGSHEALEPIGDPAKLLADFRPGRWNDYTIIAKGGDIRIFINRVPMAALQDDDPKRLVEGMIGLQLHAGMGPMTVRFRNLRLKQL
jgi:type 1 glutamine amidotransferase